MNNKYKYLITLIIGLLFAFIYAVLNNIFAQTDREKIFHILTDSFFVPGILFVCFGILVFSSNGGTFDMIKYGTVRFLSLFKRDYNDVKYKSYYEYVSEKHEKNQSFGYLIMVGIVFIIISLIFLTLL